MTMRLTPILILAATILGTTGTQASVYEAVKKPHKMRRQPWLSYQTEDSLGRAIDFYLSEPSPGDSALPLAVYVHGSGGTSHFVQDGDRIVGQNGHSTINDVVRGKARLLIVEKPGIAYLMSPGDSGIAASEYDQFRREHTLDRWCEAIHAAIIAARSLPDISKKRLLVIGHSEGGLVAAKLAADLPIVTHVAVLAGGGPSQLYDLLALANNGTFFTRIADSGPARIDYVLSQWRAILQDPDNPDAMFFGHPYRRWSSFLKTSPSEQLSSTNAKVFVAQGSEDKAVAAETAQMLYAQLLSKGKDVQYRLIEGADHSFAQTRASGEVTDGWKEINIEILEWFLNDIVRQDESDR